MTTPLTPAAAGRRYVTAQVLFWLPIGLTIASTVLLYTERGMALTAIAGFFAAHSLTAAALELPTGGLSDVLGRRVILATAGLLNVTALLFQALGTASWALTLGMALMGAGRALSSGPAEAWYVDTVHADGDAGPEAQASLRAGLARGSTASSAALAAGTLLGGALPWALGLGPDLGARLSEVTSGAVLPLSAPALLGAVVTAGFVLYVLTSLPEPDRPAATLRGVLRSVPVTIADGLRLGGRDAVIRRVLLCAGAAGAGLATLELLTPGRAADLTGRPEAGALVFAGLACAGFLCSALGSHLAPFVARRTGGGERAVAVGLGLGATGLLVLGVTATSTHPVVTALAALAYGLVYCGLGVTGPNGNELLHRHVDASGRATALSVQSLALQLTAALAGLGAGALPAGPTPWMAGSAVLLAAALLWARHGAPERADEARPGTVHAASPDAVSIPT